MTNRILSLTAARRLVLTRQHLASPRAPATRDGIYGVVRELGCLQLDPIRAVERSHRLVVFSRVGPYDAADLDALVYQEHRLFEYWAHMASIVVTEDYPIHQFLMRRYAREDSNWAKRTRDWIAQNHALKRHILKRLRRDAPLPARLLEENGTAPKAWVSSGWTSGRNVGWMLDYLLLSGKVMVTRREGLQKWWDLTERVLPAGTPRENLAPRELTRRAAQKSLRALGVATPPQMQQHYTRGRYPNLSAILAELEHAKQIARVEIHDHKHVLPGEWYVHAADLPLVEKIARGDWEGRTTLLSPFDNLICDRKRTRQLFDFDYTIEIYTPAAKRKYGYYVLPILHHDRLIGRMDSAMDREHSRLKVNAVYAEPDAPKDAATARAVRGAIEELARFLGAQKIECGKKMPREWKRAIRDSRLETKVGLPSAVSG